MSLLETSSEGCVYLQSQTHVQFEWEFSNLQDNNAILVKLILTEDCVVYTESPREVCHLP